MLQNSKLNVINRNKFNSEQITLLKNLDSFSAPYLEERLLDKGFFKNKDEYEEALIEFKKFIFISKLVDGKVGMTSEIVDEIWHQFILFTPQYHDFCKEILGKYLHHSPHTSSTSTDDKKKGTLNFFENYRSIFGEIPEIWNVSEDCSADMCGADKCSGCGNQCSKCD